MGSLYVIALMISAPLFAFDILDSPLPNRNSSKEECQAALRTNPKQVEFVKRGNETTAYRKLRFERLNGQSVLVRHQFQSQYTLEEFLNAKGERVELARVYPRDAFPDTNWHRQFILGYEHGGHAYLYIGGRRYDFDYTADHWLDRKEYFLQNATYHLRLTAHDNKVIDRIKSFLLTDPSKREIKGLDCHERIYYLLEEVGGLSITPTNRIFASNRFYDVFNEAILDHLGRPLEKEVFYLHPPRATEKQRYGYLTKHDLQWVRDQRILGFHEEQKLFKLMRYVGGKELEAKLRELYLIDEKGEIHMSRQQLVRETLAPYRDQLYQKLDRVLKRKPDFQSSWFVEHLHKYLD